MAAVAIERFTGVETIPHLTPRDMTIAGLESILLGAHAEGVRNILAVTGDPPEAGDYPGTGAVYDVDSIGLVDLHRAAEQRRGLARPRDRRADVVLPRRRGQSDRRRPRSRGGALPSQGRGGRALRDDADPLRPRAARGVSGAARRRVAHPGARRRLADPHDRDARSASTTRCPASSSPSSVQERYAAAGADARDVGLELGQELIAHAREVANGVYVVAPFRQPLNVVELLPERLGRAGLRSTRRAGRRSRGRCG